MHSDRAGVALWAVPTIARAHAGNDDPNAVHACIGNVSKVARVVGVSGACIAAPPLIAETPAHWAIQGKDGTNGIDGTSVTFVDYFSGSAGGCSNGGARYAAGNPPVIAYVCNGTNGIDEKDGTLTSYNQLAGLPCRTGANADEPFTSSGCSRGPSVQRRFRRTVGSSTWGRPSSTCRQIYSGKRRTTRAVSTTWPTDIRGARQPASTRAWQSGPTSAPPVRPHGSVK